MKKIKALLLACVMLTASVVTSGVSGSAQERLVAIRDEEGNLEILTEDADGSLLDELLLTYESGTPTGLHAGEHGTVVSYFGHIDQHGTYIITDGSDFRWDFLKMKGTADPSDYMEWKEIARDHFLESVSMLPGAVTFEEGYEDWVDKYGSEARIFQLTFHNGLSFNQLGQMPRVAELHNDCILESAHMMTLGTAEAYWNGEFVISLQEDYNDPYVEDGEEYLKVLEEVKAFNTSWKAVYEEWEYDRQVWLDSIDAESMTPAQLEVSRREAGVASELEMINMAANACRELQEQYQDVLKSIRPDFNVSDFSATIRPISVWEMVGDLDRDGTVTSTDAAMLLEAAANYGIGNPTGGLNDDVVKDADVNADHNFNAEDAALLLAYIAENGSGNDISLETFVKNACRE